MATDKQNWTKAYNKKNPNATAAARNAAFQAWQKAKKGGSGGSSTKTQLPEGWGMDKTPDILGSWASKPNLNVDDYEVEKGLDGKYYARKRTELTGLEPYQKQAIARFDSDTASRSNLMSGVESQAINASRAIGDAGAARMADLASIIQSAAPASQGLGGVSTGGGATQQTQSADQQAGANAAGANARLAATQVAAGAQQQAQAAPTLAGYAMSSLTNQARSNDSATRQKLLSAFRSSNADALAAKNKSIAQTYTDQARLLAAAIQSGSRITAEQLSQMGQNFRNTQSNETSLANNAADNATSTANTGANNAADARADKVKTTNAFIGKIASRMDGEPSTVDDGKGGTKVTIKGGGTGWQQIVNEALAQKIPIGPVLASIKSTQRGRGLNGNAKFAMWILKRMKASGIPDRTAIQAINNNLGVNLAPGGGVIAGPPSPRR